MVLTAILKMEPIKMIRSVRGEDDFDFRNAESEEAVDKWVVISGVW